MLAGFTYTCPLVPQTELSCMLWAGASALAAVDFLRSVRHGIQFGLEESMPIANMSFFPAGCS